MTEYSILALSNLDNTKRAIRSYGEIRGDDVGETLLRIEINNIEKNYAALEPLTVFKQAEAKAIFKTVRKTSLFLSKGRVTAEIWSSNPAKNEDAQKLFWVVRDHSSDKNWIFEKLPIKFMP